ncbi:hypothetical protein StrepF001_39635 [Streptomyces sp. F001]|nr:hypothetical protein StrepF001_39635 [Streptomyces sp. F001]
MFRRQRALLGCCDVIIATSDTTLGMGGPAMIEGGGLGQFLPEESARCRFRCPTVSSTSSSRTSRRPWRRQEVPLVLPGRRGRVGLRGPAQVAHVIPENRVRVYDVREAIDLLADTGSVLELRTEFGIGVITALVRIEGRPMGLVRTPRRRHRQPGGRQDGPLPPAVRRTWPARRVVVRHARLHGGPDAETTATVATSVGSSSPGQPERPRVLGGAARLRLGAQAMAGAASATRWPWSPGPPARSGGQPGGCGPARLPARARRHRRLGSPAAGLRRTARGAVRQGKGGQRRDRLRARRCHRPG